MKPVIRCSSLPCLLNCHGSRTLQPLVKAREGDEGYEGTMIHWTVAHRLIRECGARGPAGGLAPPNVPTGYQIPKLSRWIVDWALRQVATYFPPTHAMIVEDEFGYEFDRYFLIGHKDLHTINRDATDYHGGDWKTGRKPVVSAAMNDQIKGYLALAKRAYSKLDHGKFIIGQPLNNEDDGFPRISEVELDGAGLDANLSDLDRRINEALDDPMTVDSGPIQCAWCPVGIQCPAIREEQAFMKATLTPESLASIKETADDALLGDVVIAAHTIARSLEDAERLLKERIAAQGAVIAGNGTKITAKQVGGKYSVINPEGAFEAVKFLLPPERIPHVINYSTGRLIDEIAEANKVNKGGEADITARTLFDITMRPHLEQGVSTKLVFAPQ